MADFEAFENLLKAHAERIRANWKDGSVDLYPEQYRDGIDAWNAILLNDIDKAIYKAGEAKTAEEYAENYHRFFDRLDQLEEHLKHSRYLLGDHVTESDIRLFVALTGFDVAFYFGARLNKKRLRDYKALWDYARNLYSLPAFREGTDLEAIKINYYLGYSENPDHILPDGPDVSAWLKTTD